MQHRWILVLLAAPVIMGANIGCTVLKRPEQTIANESSPPSKQKNESTSANVEAQLLATAQSIEHSLGILAAAEKAENAPLLNTEPLVTPEGGMGGKADVDWTGPIAPLLEKIATLSGYRLKCLGNEPAIPVLIAVNAKHVVLADILQNASLQAGKRAQILVFPESRLIELRYLL